MSLLGTPSLSSTCSTPPPTWTPSPATLTGIRPNPCATPLWDGPSGPLADPTPLTDSRGSIHKLSKKELSSAELEIFQKSRNSTTVITANGEVQTSEEAQVFVHDLELFVRCKYSMTRLPSGHQASSAKNTVVPMSGPVVRSHMIWPWMGKEFFARQKISVLLLSQDCLQAQARVRLLHRYRRTHPVPLRVQQDYGVTILTLKHREIEAILQNTKTQIKWRATIKHRAGDFEISWSGWRSSQIISKIQKCQQSHTFAGPPEWYRKRSDSEFSVQRTWQPGSTEYMLTSQKNEIAKSASEVRLQELLAEDALAKHYLEERTLVTWIQPITKSSMRKVNLVTITDTQSWYKILPTQWIQSYPCKTKASQESEKSLRKFLEPSQKPKGIYTDNSLEVWKSCEELSWNHRTSTPHRCETNGIAESAVRRVKEGTSAVLLQSGLDEKWWYWFLWNAVVICEMSKTFWQMGKTRNERRFGEPFRGPVIQWLNVTLPLRETSQGSINLVSKFYQEYFLGMHWSRREVGKEIFWSQTLRSWEIWTRQKSMLEGSMQRK